MATYKFRVGQKVQLVATLFERYAPAGDCEIELSPERFKSFWED